MNMEQYEEYLLENWKIAEKIATKFGSVHNVVISIIFDKITSPYFYMKNR